jgi:YHS domain-containing protein
MKTLAAAIGAAVLLGVGSIMAAEAPPAGRAAETNVVKSQTLCPIMRGAINKNVHADYEGKRVYFCCSGCIATFKKDPAKYVAKLEKDGITLDKTPAAAGK